MYVARQHLPMYGIDANPSEKNLNLKKKRNRYLSMLLFYTNNSCFHSSTIE